MESLGDILKRMQIGAGSPGARREPPPPAEPCCPVCQGIGFVHPLLEPGRPDFSRVVPCRCQRQDVEKDRLGRLQRYSNLGPLARLTFDSLLPQGRSADPQNQERFGRALSYARAFAQNPEGWLILCGASGAGKTHLAAAIANERLSQGQPTFFVVAPDLLDHLRATYSPNSDISYDMLLEQVRNAPLLILDDLGTQSSTPWAQEKLFQIINHRYNSRLPTVITTNTLMEDMDERLRTRLTDPSLSKVCVLEERGLLVVKQVASHGLETLKDNSFDNFDFKRRDLPVEQRRSLAEAYRICTEFAKSPEGWLVLSGASGCGKTHLAAAMGNQRLSQGYPVFFRVVPDLLDHFRAAYGPESKVTYDALFDHVRNVSLLILDDLGAESSTSWAHEKLFQIMNHRYNTKLATIITSRYTPEKMGGAIGSRMRDLKLSTVVEIKAPAYYGDTEATESPANAPRRRRPGIQPG
ncbi:MAG: ATP-binding protein [Dehalococcoidia bacterium]|nr:ATP-binding protein [Dehalococcoidia bacterium]